MTVMEMLRSAASSTPAVISDAERSCSLSDLLMRSDALASKLRKAGFAGSRIGVLLDRSVLAVESLLGILIAGACYVPLGVAMPAKRIAAICADAGVSLLLCDRSRLAEMQNVVDHVWSIGDDVLRDDHRESEEKLVDVGAQDLAYICYTSGSSGLPKGVMIDHGSLANFVTAHLDLLPISAGDICAMTASMVVDGHVFHLFLALCSGASLVIADAGTARGGSDFARWIQANAITFLPGPPSVLASLPRSAHLPSLRTVVVGADACPPALADYWSARVAFFNSYGPTEATCACALGRCTRETGVHAGEAVAGAVLSIRSPDGRRVAQGSAGELYIGGACLARGYVSETADDSPFVILPASDSAGERLYRSGDLARVRPDGMLEILGRVDRQTKIGGYRVEPAEVEHAIRAFPNVENAVVLPVVRNGDTALCAFLVRRKRAPSGTGTHMFHLRQDGETLRACEPAGANAEPLLAHERRELISFLAAELPSYMVPKHFVVVDRLPTTDHGKIDTAALLAMPLPEIVTATERLPSTKAERYVHAFWTAAFGSQRIGVEDNFFELGGDSLAAAALLARIEDDCALPVSLDAFYLAPTISGLATSLAGAVGSAGDFEALLEVIAPSSAERIHG